MASLVASESQTQSEPRWHTPCPRCPAHASFISHFAWCETFGRAREYLLHRACGIASFRVRECLRSVREFNSGPNTAQRDHCQHFSVRGKRSNRRIAGFHRYGFGRRQRIFGDHLER